MMEAKADFEVPTLEVDLSRPALVVALMAVP